VGLYDVVSREFETPKDPNKPRKRGMVDQWVDELENDASYSFSSFAECFISENLVRKHITQKKIALSKEAMKEISDFKEKETKNKKKGNISIEIRKAPTGTSYLSMDGLANLVDKPKDPAHEAALSRDANEYKPIRDALMHTALLTDEAKKKLTSVFENIKGRVKTLLSKG
jgi:chaperonin cofactor prefoldin